MKRNNCKEKVEEYYKSRKRFYKKVLGVDIEDCPEVEND